MLNSIQNCRLGYRAFATTLLLLLACLCAPITHAATQLKTSAHLLDSTEVFEDTKNGCITNVPPTSKVRVFQVVTEGAFPPFSWVDKDGHLKGFDVETFLNVAQRANIPVRICYVKFSDALDELANKKIDGVMAAMSYTPERARLFDYSIAYYHTKAALVVPKQFKVKSLSDLKGKKVGVKDRTVSKFVLESYKQELMFDIHSYNTSVELMTALKDGEVEIAMEDEPVATKIIDYLDYDNLTILKPSMALERLQTDMSYHFLVHRDTNAVLLSLFNKGLQDLKSHNLYQKLVNKYLIADADDEGCVPCQASAREHLQEQVKANAAAKSQQEAAALEEPATKSKKAVTENHA